MVCLTDPLVQKICHLYDKISRLDNLHPSPPVNALFSQLVLACIPPHPIDVSTHLSSHLHHLRSHLISLCAHAESLLERHHASRLASLSHHSSPLHHLHSFPYYSNYLKLTRLESDLLRPHAPSPRRVAFVGSGPLPLTSILLASQHLPSAAFDNFDLDPSANALAARLVAPDPDLSRRMTFVTQNIADVPAEALRQYDVVFLAALVGTEAEEKARVIEHLAAGMAPGAILMLRSAHGARAFLYPVVEPRHLRGFEVLSVYHPTDEVINSVVVARKPVGAAGKQQHALIMPCNKYGETNRLQAGQMNLVEVEEEHLC